MKICLLPVLPKDGTLKKVEIKYPNDNTSRSFLYNAKSFELFELIKFSEKYRSWFVGDFVLQDGSLFLITKVDVILVFLNFLNRLETKFNDIYHIVKEQDILYKCLTQNPNIDLQVILDMKKIDDDVYVKYNSEKTLKFLRYKIFKLNACLKANSVQVSDNFVQVANFTGSKQEEADESDYTAFSINLLADYIPKCLVDKLFEYYDIREEQTNKQLQDNKQDKKRKHESDEPVNDYSKLMPQDTINKKQKVLTRAEKQLSKVDKTGMKSIASFFQKKTSW